MNDLPQPRTALRPAYDDQNRVFTNAFSVLREGIEQRAFPGAVAAVTRGDELLALKAVGRFTYDLASPEVRPDTIWDLASVTKVIATIAMAMILYERGELDIEVPLASIIPEFTRGSRDPHITGVSVPHICPPLADMGRDPRRTEVTIRMLLAHSSGLPSYYRLYEYCHSREAVLASCYKCELTADPDTRAEYSDIGFILLGVALERIAGETLDSFCRREVFGKLGMAQTTFNPPPQVRRLIPPTEDDQRFRQRIIQAEVNDENAWVLGGVAGHAGIFSTATDVARFGHCMVSGGSPILRPETVEFFTRREASPPGTSRALGWDTPSQPSQSGKYFSPRSFGHLGFTGTSLWCDPEQRITITLLTNRTWPDRESQKIKQIRPRFHDAVMEALE